MAERTDHEMVLYCRRALANYGHVNIIKFCDRPFESIGEMNEALIHRHNMVVTDNDTVVHVGDFTLHRNTEEVYTRWINRLNGTHIFLRGSHDRWIKKGPASSPFESWERKINDQWIVACHYPMRSWPKTFHGSWHVFGHVHGRLDKNRIPRSVDVGVDSWSFAPVSFEEIADICIKDNLEEVEKKEQATMAVIRAGEIGSG